MPDTEKIKQLERTIDCLVESLNRVAPEELERCADFIYVEDALDKIKSNEEVSGETNEDDPFAKYKDKYGVVTYKHRFSINRSLDDYEEITLNKCIRMGVEFKYKTVACDKLVAEMQILYRDDENRIHCLCKDLHDYTFKIKHLGQMDIQI